MQKITINLFEGGDGLKGIGEGQLANPGDNTPELFNKFLSGTIGIITIIAFIYFLFFYYCHT